MSENASPFHRGEKQIQSRLGVEEKIEKLGRRAIQSYMSDHQQEFYSQLPLLFVASADATGRPWASVLSGNPGFLQAIDATTLKVKARPFYGDILNRALVEGAPIGTLGLDLETRNRVRMNGVIANPSEDSFEIRVWQSYANCDEYIQARKQIPGPVNSVGEKPTVHRGKVLNQSEAALVARSDTFFIASQCNGTGNWTDGIDVSHRGVLPGSIIVAHESSLLFPDYPGNNMFNTLGNLQVDPRAGLLFIDFETGDTLQVTGAAEILWEPHHTQRFLGADRVVAFRVEETLYIERVFPILWTFSKHAPRLDTFQVTQRQTSVAGELPAMKLISVNVAKAKEIMHENKPVTTSIFKTPVEGRRMLRWLNLEADGQADRWGHGGTFRAVYVYSLENYAYWQSELGRDDFRHGQFGENFTVEGMLDDAICIGDIFRIGGALVEVSQPRIPCYKLAIKMGIDNFQNRFLESGRTGFYFRVLEEGEVGPGDMFELVSRDSQGMSVREVSNLLFFNTADLEGTRRALSIPALAHGWKGSFEERLAKAQVGTETVKGFRDFIVQHKQAESQTISSFYLAAADDAPLAEYLPGQFLTFELAIPGQPQPVMRTYSLSDSPGHDYYRVSIKREPPPPNQPNLPAGLSSNYFHDHIQVGTTLRVGPPRGRFHLDLESERSVVLLSGGVGLTPLISMLNTLVESGSTRSIWFIHGTRNGREHAMGAHVRRLAKEHNNVKVHICYSAPEPEDVPDRDYDSQGHVDIALLKQLLPFDNFEFYLCGPAAFMRSLYCGLLSLGVAESRIHYEFFGPGSALMEETEPCGQAPVRTAQDELGGACKVTFARSGVTATWDPDCETILDLAERQGLNPPYSCRSGICRTCMCELVEGEVEYLEEPLNAPDPGCVLICVSRPKTQSVVDI